VLPCVWKPTDLVDFVAIPVSLPCRASAEPGPLTQASSAQALSCRGAALACLSVCRRPPRPQPASPPASPVDTRQPAQPAQPGTCPSASCFVDGHHRPLAIHLYYLCPRVCCYRLGTCWVPTHLPTHLSTSACRALLVHGCIINEDTWFSYRGFLDRRLPACLPACPSICGVPAWTGSCRS
jgi:hypothetical protein